MFSPLFVFIAVIFFTSKLAENSEIIAMFSTGMSFRRMMVPYLISAAFISLFTLYLGSNVIPKGNVIRLNFEQKYNMSHTSRDNSDGSYNIQLEVEDGVIAYIESFQTYNMTGYRFALDKFEGKKLVSHLTARTATYDTLSSSILQQCPLLYVTWFWVICWPFAEGRLWAVCMIALVYLPS